MRTAIGLLVLSASSIAGAAEGGFAEDDFSQVRIGLGVVSGYHSDQVEQSYLNGGRDPANDYTRHLSGRIGIDFEPSLALGHAVDDTWGLVFTAGPVLRTPGATYSSDTDTGVANGAPGGGDVIRTDRMRVDTMLFGAKFAVGPFWKFGKMRLELTPFLGGGAAWGRFLFSRVYSNDPNGLFAAQDSNAHFTERGRYLEYGVTTGLYWKINPWVELGFTGGYQAATTQIAVDQHGPVFDQAEHHFHQSGVVLNGTAIWSF
jgi:hypothetical protein